MYLRSSGRLAFGCSFVFSLLLLALGITTFAVASEDEKGRSAGCSFLILAFIFGLVSIPFMRYLRSESRRRVLQLDVLGETLGFPSAAERDGVQWVSLFFPDAVSAPARVVLGVVLQNAHGKRRRVRVSVRGGPLPPSWPSIPVELRGGETVILRIPILIPASAADGTQTVAVELSADAPEGEGVRVIRRDGLPPRRSPVGRHVSIEVTGRHGGEPLNPFAKDWSGPVSLHLTGQEKPDLESLRLLEELRGKPS
jgi:hypothetical protein